MGFLSHLLQETNMNIQHQHHDKWVIILGISWAGMNGIAQILKDQSYNVIGVDPILNRASEYLKSIGITVHHDQNDMWIIDDFVNQNKEVYILASSAIPDTHPIIQYASEHNIQVLHRKDIWKEWSKQKKIIGISGSDGKTTVTAMIAHIFKMNKLEYGYLVWVHGEGAGKWWEGEWMVLEADEFKKTFLSLDPSIAIIHNIHRDHFDVYPTEESYNEIFHEFVRQVKDNNGDVLINNADSGIKHAFPNSPELEKYDLTNKDALHVENISYSDQWTHFDIYDWEQLIEKCDLHIFGEYNIGNVFAAIVTAHKIGISIKDSCKAMQSFYGLPRRLERLTTVNDRNIIVYDDYAHTPEGVERVLSWLRDNFKQRRIVAYFQPHTFKRFNEWFQKYAKALVIADVVFVGDVYASRDITGYADMEKFRELIESPEKYLSWWIDNSMKMISENLQDGDIVICMNAGDGYKVAHHLSKFVTND